uniref:Putative VRR-NUC domain-containing protein n=1 Tax=viral metagenome TaxID=1070528 RepID=A0A6M3L522_9ZZZZ
MTSVKENKMTSKIVKHIKLKKIPYLEIIRVTPGVFGSMRGVSDLLFCYHGFFIAIEMKVPGNSPTDHQERFLKKIEKAKGFSYICHSKEEVMSALNESLKSIKRRGAIATEKDNA